MIKLNWGKGMALTMIGFMAFIITMAVLMSRIDTNLVEKDYYEKGQNYNAVAEMKSNYNSEDSLLSIQKSTEHVLVTFREIPDSGMIHYFRPADKSKDLKFRFTSKKMMPLERSKLLPGVWKIRILFYKNGKGYFTEEDFQN